METLEKKFRDFLITPTMALAPLIRTSPVTSDIIPQSPVVWEDNLKHIKDVVSEMRSKQKIGTDQLLNDLEIISISSPKQVTNPTSRSREHFNKCNNTHYPQVLVKRKILAFYENHRPAYCGSWRKTSTVIGPRRPLGQDKGLLEYEYDSDDDWEEEEEGEDITSEKEEDKEEEKDKEDDDDEDGTFY